MFGTFTLQGGDPTVERLSDAWRQFERNYLSRRCSGALTYRVFEAGGRRGRPHVHFVTTAPLPVVPKIGRHERKAHWVARLSPEALEFQRHVVGAGFGPILHAEIAHTSGGVAAYLTGYVSKGERQLVSESGRRVRLTGCSRAWPRMRPGRTYRVGRVERAPDGEPEWECTECAHEHREAAEVRAATGSSEGYDAIRRRNVEAWLRPALLDPSMKDTVEQLYETRKEYYRQVRTGAGPESLVPLVGRIEGLAIKLRAVHGYEGSMVLLNDWRRAGYDVETLLGLGKNVRPNDKKCASYVGF